MAKDHRLLLLCAGWSAPDFAWQPFQKRFQKFGYDTIRAIYPYRGYTPVQHSAKPVGKLIESLRDSYDHITVVGHSMGGLVGRYLIQRKQSPIDAYVSLGTPHKGTYLANLVRYLPGSQSMHQMMVGSDFLNRLNELPWPDNVPALSIAGGWETLVRPRSNSHFNHAEQVTIPCVTHASLIFDPRVSWEVWSWLTFSVFEERPADPLLEGISTTMSIA